MALWVYDWETMLNIAEVSFLSFDSDEYHTFIIDDDTGRNDRKEITEFIRGQTLVGYNSKTFDDIITNFVVKHSDVTAKELHRLAAKIIGGQKEEGFNVYREFGPYMNSDLYKSIDLMRLLFSKKLRVGLKELECSLHHDNVEELPFDHNKYLSSEEKEQVISYNVNDCRATKLVLQKSIEALQLRRWMMREYGIDAYSMDGVNGGVKILEVLYEKLVGSSAFKKQTTVREYIYIRDIILPQVKFKTKSFNKVLKVYQDHIWYSKDFDETLSEDSKLTYEPLIANFRFKFSLGGLHGFTQAKTWESNDEYEIWSVDVASYYPKMVMKHKFCPEHLNSVIFHTVYGGVIAERLDAKAKGDKLKDGTLKLSINGSFGMFGNKYSWLFDHKVRLQICVNGQLFLAMLIEKLMLEDIILIDANTDGVYVYVHKSKLNRFQEIIKEWENDTLMEMECTKFEKMWFVNTADYFGTYYKFDKKKNEMVLEVKEKGVFQSNVQLGKGMEFPIIARSVKNYFLKGESFEQAIKNCNNILDFCSYKKLNRDTECWHNNKKIQRINRFYATKSGAYLFRKGIGLPAEEIVLNPDSWSNGPVKIKKSNMQHLLKESPVIIYNKFDDKPMSERKINYGFYTSAARKMVYAIEGDRAQTQLF